MTEQDSYPVVITDELLAAEYRRTLDVNRYRPAGELAGAPAELLRERRRELAGEDTAATALRVLTELAREVDAARALISCDPPDDYAARHAIRDALQDARACLQDAIAAAKRVQL